MEHSLLVLATLLFVIGLSGLLIRRSLLVVILCVELTLLAAALAFVAFGDARDDPGGLSRAALLLFFGVVQAVLGVASAIAVFRRRATVNVDELRELRG